MASITIEEQRPAATLIGAAVRRTEDLPYLRGTSRYVDDITPSKCYYLGLVRSNYGNAKIISIDTSKLSHLKGVISVLTGEEMRKHCKPIFNWLPLKWLKTVDVYPLAIDRVRFVGEPVVAVVCETKELAKDVLDLVSIDYEPLPALVDAEKALEPDAPVLYEEWGDNQMLHYTFRSGDPDSAFAAADLIVRERISCHRHSPAPLEPNTYLASYDPASGLTLWATTQHAHVLRTIVAETIGVSESTIRVIQPDVGGGFGGKSPVHAEEILVSFLAFQLMASVKYTEERIEHLRSSHQAREQTHYIEAAVRRDGTILALRDKVVANLGVYYPTSGPNSVINASRFVPGCYHIENYEAEVLGAATNKAPYGAYRGFGKDAASYVIERLMDIIARKLKVDPIALRLKNVVPKDKFPYRSVTGALYDSGDYVKSLQKLMDIIDYRRLRKEQSELRKKGVLMGIGISLVLEPASSHAPNSFFTGYDGSTVRLQPSGSVTVLTGVTSTGTGTKTVFAQIAADELSMPLESISVVQGDSDICPYGYGMWASRGIVVGGNSVLLASRKLRGKILKIAASLLSAQVSDLVITSGVVQEMRHPKMRLTFKEIASAFYRSTNPLPRELIETGLEETFYYFPPTVESVLDKEGRRNAYATYANSACAAIVEVDVETGVMKILRYVFVGDAGKVINPLILQGQIHGGVVQGIGGAVYEENYYDQDGQPLTTTFMDYLIPTSIESPEIVVAHIESPAPSTALGAKGAGEGPIEGAYGTIANAVEDALEPLGAQVRELPLTPERIWKMIKASGKTGVRS